MTVICNRRSRRRVCLILTVASLAFVKEPTASAQTSAPSPAEANDADQVDDAGNPGRLFGILPNASTIEAGMHAGRVTTKQTFTFATQDSIDKNVFAFVGVVAFFGVGQPNEPYRRRYATALADNTLGNYMTTAILPFLLQQDPRYFQLGAGSAWHRAVYAASRSVVTRSRDGRAQFNASEVGGSVLASMVANTYYPPPQRSPRETLARAGSQLMWDTVSYECKEFWPDVRTELQRVFHHHHD